MRYFSSFRDERTPATGQLKCSIGAFASLDARQDVVPKSLSLCSYGYNIRFTGGILRNSYGVKLASWTAEDGSAITLPTLQYEGENLKRLHVIRRTTQSGEEAEELLAYSAEGKFYVCPLTETSSAFTYFPGITDVTEDITFINYFTGGADTALIYTENGAYKYDGTFVKVDGAPGLVGACMHYDRVFGIKPGARDTIAFSALLDPFEFSVESGGGEISLMDEGGKILKLISIRNSVYIFREYAVYRMTAYVDPTEYTISRVFSSDKPIRQGSVASDGDRVFFVSGEDIFVLTSSGADRSYEEISPLISDASHAVGHIFDGTYYLAACIAKEGDESVGDESVAGAITQNNALFGFGFARGTLDIVRGTDIRWFAGVVNDDISALLVVFGGVRSAFPGMLTDDGKLFGLPLKKLWRSHFVRLGDPEALKTVRRIYLDTVSDVNITLESETGDKLGYIAGGSKMAVAIPSFVIGDRLKMSLESVFPDFRIGEAVVYINQYGRYLGDAGNT